ncbi:MAG: chalcone isomerase family protein [Candidatus Competibacteraceae bacterium]
MAKTLRSLFIILLSNFLVFPVLAKECQGVQFPDRVQVGNTALALNGLGLREATLFKVNVYVAALYLENPSTDPETILKSNQSKQLTLQFLRDVGREDISKAWSEGFATSSGNALPALEERINTLNGWMKDIAKGDRLTFTYQPDTGLRVEVGGATHGPIQGEDFARAFFAIWLGDKPPNAGLKTGLLGGPCG